jgi:hypothetical protein
MMKKSAMLGRATTGGVVTTPIAQPPEPPTPHVGSNIRIEHDGCQHERHSDAGSDQKTCERHVHGLEAYALEEHGLEEHGLHRAGLTTSVHGHTAFYGRTAL